MSALDVYGVFKSVMYATYNTEYIMMRAVAALPPVAVDGDNSLPALMISAG